MSSIIEEYGLLDGSGVNERKFSKSDLKEIDTINNIGVNMSDRMKGRLLTVLGSSAGVGKLDGGSDYTPLISSTRLSSPDTQFYNADPTNDGASKIQGGDNILSGEQSGDVSDNDGGALATADKDKKGLWDSLKAGFANAIDKETTIPGAYTSNDLEITENIPGAGPTKTNILGTAIGRSFVVNPPFQLNEHDDVRSNLYFPHVGRVFNEKIHSQYPVAMFEVGRIKYSTNLLTGTIGEGGTDDRIASQIRGDGEGGPLDLGVGLVKTVLITSWNVATFPLRLGVEGVKWLFGLNKYAVFVPQPKLYHKYVNDLLITLGTMMGLVTPTTDDKGDPLDYSEAQNIADSDTKGSTTQTAAETVKDLANNVSSNVISDADIEKLASAYKDFSADNVAASDGYAGRVNSVRLHQFLPMDSIYGSSFVPFLINKEVSISESISNSTQQNPLQSTLNAAASEAQSNKVNNYMTGTGNVFQETLKGIQTRVDTFSKTLLKGESGTVISGEGRIALPEMWTDSSFSRTISLSFDFTSPYGHDLALFENTYFPFILLFAMTMPRQIGSKSFTSPFIVRVNARGLFTIPMGIIESLSIERGEDRNNWTSTARCKTIKCNVTIKDISPAMMMSMTRGLFFSLFQSNDSFSSYLSVLGGLSLHDQRNLLKRGERFWTMAKDRVNSIRRVAGAISDKGMGVSYNEQNFLGNMVGGLPGIGNIAMTFGKLVHSSSDYDSLNSIDRK